MASFGNSVPICDFCFFGSSCNASQVNPALPPPDANATLMACVCAPGFVHDDVFFHDPNCSIPSPAKFVWFILETLVAAGLLLFIVQTDPTFADCQYACSRCLGLNAPQWSEDAESPAVSSRHLSPQRAFQLSAPRGRRKRFRSNENQKYLLRKLNLVVVMASWLYVAGIYAQGRAGAFSNVMYGVIILSLAHFMYIAVIYVVKPLFRVMGRSQFERLRKNLRIITGVFASFFATVVIVWTSRNGYGDMNDPSTEARRIAYNRMGSMVAMWAMIFALSFGVVLSTHISKLMRKLAATQSFRDGDIVFTTNYARLLKVRRQTWSLSLDILTGSPWLITQWVIGSAPFFWVFGIISFLLGPIFHTWFQYTLTTSASSTAEYNNQQNFAQQSVDGQDRSHHYPTPHRSRGVELDQLGIDNGEPDCHSSHVADVPVTMNPSNPERPLEHTGTRILPTNNNAARSRRHSSDDGDSGSDDSSEDPYRLETVQEGNEDEERSSVSPIFAFRSSSPPSSLAAMPGVIQNRTRPLSAAGGVEAVIVEAEEEHVSSSSTSAGKNESIIKALDVV